MENKEDVVKERVQKRKERHEKLNKKLRETKHEIKSTETYIGRLDYVQKEIEEYKSLTKGLDEDILDVFHDVGRVMKNNRVLLNGAMGDDLNRSYQLFLADKADTYLKEWLIRKGEEPVYRIKVRAIETFPSIYAIYKGEQELIQFSLTNKWYGIREKGKTEEDIKRIHDIDIVRLNNEKKDREEELRKWQDIKEEPHTYYKGIMNKLTLWTKSKEEIEGYLDKQIRNCESWVLEAMENMEWKKQNYEIKLKEEKNKIEAEKILVPFFNEQGYQNNTTEYSLY